MIICYQISKCIRLKWKTDWNLTKWLLYYGKTHYNLGWFLSIKWNVFCEIRKW